MLFTYKVISQNGQKFEGEIEAINQDVAISSLQNRGFIVADIRPAEKKSPWEWEFSFGSGISTRDIVIVSRQIATLFEAQVSALRIFRLLATEMENKNLQRVFAAVADDLQGGSSISRALAKHPQVFSEFYVNMVRTGEETGKLDEVFTFLADYLDRTYEITSKARNALVYPAFVIATFIIVMWLMLTMVIPRLGDMLRESGLEPPVYTKVVLALSDFATSYSYVLLFLIAALSIALWRYYRTPQGRLAMDELKLRLPAVGNLYRKLYLSRIADNVSTMLDSGISMVRTLEVTAEVVDNAVYRTILRTALQEVKNGMALSGALSRYPEIPSIMVQMIRVGEETGELGTILRTLSKFYRREVENAVDTLIGLIEPAMIVALGLGVGVLLASVLIPIYNITLSIQ